MTQAGAGTLGNYSGCAFTTPGEGRFICEEGSRPYIGEEGKEATAKEDRLEMLVPPERIKAVRAAMLVNHPYEQPAYDIVETSCLLYTSQLACGIVRQGRNPVGDRPGHR